MNSMPGQPHRSRGLLAGLLAAPVFEDAERTERARVFHRVAWTTALLVTAIVPVVTVVQPDTVVRAIRVILVVDLMVLATVILNHSGRTNLVSWTYILVVIALLTYNAPEAGGIRSPGVQAYFIFVMLAGLLLGQRAGMIIAVVCMVLGLGLVLLELRSIGPPRRHTYNAWALWLLTCVYIGVALLTIRVAIDRVGGALATARAELAVRRTAEERLSRALDAGRIGIFDHDLATGAFRGDARALALTGLTAGPDGQIPFQSWLSLVHTGDRERVLADIALFAGGQQHGYTHYRLVRPDGALRFMEAAAYLATDAAGTPASLLGMVMDVTERQESEQHREQLVADLGERVKELRLLHDFSRLLQQASGIDRILLTDLVAAMPGAWRHSSDACARIVFRDMEVRTSGWRETPWRQSAAFTTSDGPGLIEVCYLSEHESSDEGPFLAEERALVDSLAEMLGSTIERHVAEKQRRGMEAQLRQAQKMDALGTLAGGIAHDFNNILTAIGGNAQLAKLEAPAQGALAESVAGILAAHERARDLVRRILLFSRQQETSREVISLEPVVDDALKLLRSSLPPSIAIKAKAAPQLPAVSADATQLHQVVMNLGTNAGYAMKESGGTLSFAIDTITIGEAGSSSSADLEPGPYVRLSVADTGVGMSREVMERLFEPFFTTKADAGTGLGLAVVHGIIRDHGGAIAVESEPGIGTRFEVFLPAQGGNAVASRPAVADIVRGAGQRIMYVDDEPSLTHVMSRTLTYLGYRCSGFTDAVAALQEFRTAPATFDAVVTDLQMPDMSGLDLVRAIRAIRPGTPVAVASGYAAGKVPDDAAESVVWISKPSTLSELSAALGSLVRRADRE